MEVQPPLATCIPLQHIFHISHYFIIEAQAAHNRETQEWKARIVKIVFS